MYTCVTYDLLSQEDKMKQLPYTKRTDAGYRHYTAQSGVVKLTKQKTREGKRKASSERERKSDESAL
jgi:hypothetical protein